MRHTGDVHVSGEVGTGEEVQLFLLLGLSTKEDPIPIRAEVRAVSMYDLTVCEARSRNGLALVLVSRDERGAAVFKYVFTDFAGEEQSWPVVALFRFTPDRRQLHKPYFINPSEAVQFGYAWRGQRPPLLNGRRTSIRMLARPEWETAFFIDIPPFFLYAQGVLEQLGD